MDKISIVLILWIVLFLSSCSLYVEQPQNLQSPPTANKIVKGMTSKEVIETWGMPNKINKLSNREYDEEWIYITNWNTKKRLYFKNAVLVGGIKQEKTK